VSYVYFGCRFVYSLLAKYNNSKVSPETAYRSDHKALNFLDKDRITNAFLHCEQRKVDKAGCISFDGHKYEVGIAFVGCAVDVVYDPVDLTELTIESEGHPPWTARQLVIGAYSGKRPKLPEHFGIESANSSRLLVAAAIENEKRKTKQTPAVSYRKVDSKENGHV